MRTIPARLRQSVIERANNRCEYCQLSQAGQAATFHIDHIVPVAAGGATASDNLALACVACSLNKGSEHFCWEGVHVIGLTPTGRATVAALKMNRPISLAIRAEEAVFNRHPPK